jgi:hypothetical protein
LRPDKFFRTWVYLGISFKIQIFETWKFLFQIRIF